MTMGEVADVVDVHDERSVAPYREEDMATPRAFST